MLHIPADGKCAEGATVYCHIGYVNQAEIAVRGLHDIAKVQGSEINAVTVQVADEYPELRA